MSKLTLHLNNIRKSFVEANGSLLPILDIPDFRVAAGEQMVLIGRSGSGKSTLLHVISGISRPDRGEVIVDGVDMTRMPESVADRYRADKIGYVFQTFNLLAGFTAIENVMLGMTFSRGRADRRRAMELLDRVGLATRMTHKPQAMSVGERQRVAVARALANRPRLVLADEPTANVDPANQQSVIDLIRESCRAEEVSLVLVTHSMEIAEQFERVDRLEDINLLARSVSERV